MLVEYASCAHGPYDGPVHDTPMSVVWEGEQHHEKRQGEQADESLDKPMQRGVIESTVCEDERARYRYSRNSHDLRLEPDRQAQESNHESAHALWLHNPRSPHRPLCLRPPDPPSTSQWRSTAIRCA